MKFGQKSRELHLGMPWDSRELIMGSSVATEYSWPYMENWGQGGRGGGLGAESLLTASSEYKEM